MNTPDSKNTQNRPSFSCGLHYVRAFTGWPMLNNAGNSFENLTWCSELDCIFSLPQFIYFWLISNKNYTILVICNKWQKRNATHAQVMYHWLSSKWLCDLELDQKEKDWGPVVRRPISANPRLDFNLGFFFLFIKGILSNYFLSSF